MSLILLILGLLLFILLVVIHEFGHFIMARRNGVVVEEFGVGFPPRAKRLLKRNGTEYTLNWLPLGGFVRLKGEHDADTAPGSYGAAPLWVKVKIMLAGVALNLITAFILLTILALTGMPQLIKNQFTVPSDTTVTRQQVLIANVIEGSPADKAGITDSDELAAIGLVGKPKDFITTAEQMPDLTKKYAGQTVELITRSGADSAQLHTLTLLSEEDVAASRGSDNPKGYLGITPVDYQLKRSTWSAPLVAAGMMKQVTQLTLKGLGTAITSLFKGDTETASKQVSGPVGIFYLLKRGSLLGIELILLIIALISLTLAIMNVLPIPALDGGRLFVTMLYRTVRKPLTKEAEETIHGLGFMLLMVLFVAITIVDINRIN